MKEDFSYQRWGKLNRFRLYVIEQVYIRDTFQNVIFYSTIYSQFC